MQQMSCYIYTVKNGVNSIHSREVPQTGLKLPPKVFKVKVYMYLQGCKERRKVLHKHIRIKKVCGSVVGVN